MNTTTVSPSPALAAITSPIIEDSIQQVTNLRAQLEAAEAKLKEDQDTVAAAAREEMRARIVSVPSLLGVATIHEAIALMKPFVSPGKFPGRLSEETLAQMKAMLTAGSTSRAVSEVLKCGISTVDNHKAAWKLTHRTPNGTRHVPRRAKPSNGHIAAPKRAQIVADLLQPNARVAVIARARHVSRQSIYSIRSTIPELRQAA